MAATKFVRVGYANMQESNKDLLLGSTSSVVKKNCLLCYKACDEDVKTEGNEDAAHY